MAGLDLTAFNPALKTLYPKGVPETLTLKDHPYWARLKKTQDFTGKNLQLPFKFADPMSRSRTFATALNARTTSSSALAQVTLTRGHQYGVIQIDRETMLASMDNAGAFLQARKMEIDGMINELGNSISIDLFGDASGIRGTINGTYTVAAPYALTDPNQIVNFEVGQQLAITAAVPAFGVQATVVSSSTTAYIIGIDRDAGTVSLGSSAASTTVLSANAAFGVTLTNATNYYLFNAGDNVLTSSTSTTSAIVGLAGWLPLTAPANGENFFGLDRSRDATRLGGIRFAGTGLPIEEVLVKCAARVARDGGRPDLVVVNYAQWSNLATSLSSKVRYSEFKVGEVGFPSFKISGPKGDLEVVADGDCPSGNGYMLQESTWSFRHLSGAPELSMTGNVGGVLQEAAADAIQVRAMCYGQTMCEAPGYNANFTLDQ